MRLSMTDVDAVMLQRELEMRHLMRTNYKAATSRAGVPAQRRTAGIWRSLTARFARRPATPAERLNTSPQSAA